MQDDSTTELTRTCRECRQDKPVDKFYLSHGKRNSICIACRKAYEARYSERQKLNYSGPKVAGKLCGLCKRVKFAVFFAANKRRSDGLDCYCVDCRADSNARADIKRSGKREVEYSFLKRYNLTLEQYRAILQSQDGKCAICQSDTGVKFIVDHCHKTGKVRGILCRTCNTMLAGIETPGFIERSLAYLNSRCVVDTGILPDNK